ncbi:unnamed protein product [Brassicogethes aeneus]|uniref:rRNA 2'-O-methyltransferase fibrillarin n=1 Tax=Brassicogethes aeneus TaxID=1431903 RepID=A0A9P0ALN4_BRAAE|nr:unnamed protein product [Brassicogethes aeneus]
MVDTIFADVAQPDQARIVALNAQYFLKNGGHFVISIKASCIDSTAQPEAVFAAEVKKLQTDKLKPQEQITLEPYERDHAVVKLPWTAQGPSDMSEFKEHVEEVFRTTKQRYLAKQKNHGLQKKPKSQQGPHKHSGAEPSVAVQCRKFLTRSKALTSGTDALKRALLPVDGQRINMDGEKIEKLILLVNEYEELYDMSNKNYSNQNRREIIWGEIGKKINESGEFSFMYVNIINVTKLTTI